MDSSKTDRPPPVPTAARPRMSSVLSEKERIADRSTRRASLRRVSWQSSRATLPSRSDPRVDPEQCTGGTTNRRSALSEKRAISERSLHLAQTRSVRRREQNGRPLDLESGRHDDRLDAPATADDYECSLEEGQYPTTTNVPNEQLVMAVLVEEDDAQTKSTTDQADCFRNEIVQAQVVPRNEMLPATKPEVCHRTTWVLLVGGMCCLMFVALNAGIALAVWNGTRAPASPAVSPDATHANKDPVFYPAPILPETSSPLALPPTSDPKPRPNDADQDQLPEDATPPATESPVSPPTDTVLNNGRDPSIDSISTEPAKIAPMIDSTTVTPSTWQPTAIHASLNRAGNGVGNNKDGTKETGNNNNGNGNAYGRDKNG